MWNIFGRGFDSRRLHHFNPIISASYVEIAAQKSGATIINSSFHTFEPQGVSGVVIIAESHFTIHAWPEHDYAAVDIFTECA